MQTSVKTEAGKYKNKWYLRYLPFIAKPQYMQVEWLAAECKKNILSKDELLPYVRLLFSLDSEEERVTLQYCLARLDEDVIYSILDAADLYIIAQVIELIPEMNSLLTEVVLLKEMPPYERKPQKIMDEVFYSINQRAGGLLDEVACRLIKEGRAPKGFQANYARFKEILADEEFIRTQWPSAK
jgi:hypothetical protein